MAGGVKNHADRTAFRLLERPLPSPGAQGVLVDLETLGRVADMHPLRELSQRQLAALEEAEEEFEAAEAAGREEQEESAWAADQGGENGEDGMTPARVSPANTTPGAPHRGADRKRRTRTREKRLRPRMPMKPRKLKKKSTHKRNNSSPQDWVHPNPSGLFSYRLTLHRESLQIKSPCLDWHHDK